MRFFANSISAFMGAAVLGLGIGLWYHDTGVIGPSAGFLCLGSLIRAVVYGIEKE